MLLQCRHSVQAPATAPIPVPYTAHDARGLWNIKHHITGAACGNCDGDGDNATRNGKA